MLHSWSVKFWTKFLIFFGTLITLITLCEFQIPLEKAETDVKNYLRIDNLQDAEISNLQLAWVNKRLDALERRTVNPSLPGDPKINTDRKKCENLNQRTLNDLKNRNGNLNDIVEHVSQISLWGLIIGTAICFVGTILDLCLSSSERKSLARGKVIRQIMEFLKILLRVLNYFYIPIVFGGLALLHLTGRFTVDWIVILLTCIALSPKLLPLTTQYVDEISIGLKGITTKTRSGVINLGVGKNDKLSSSEGSKEQKTTSRQEFAMPATPTYPEVRFQDLIRPSQTILKTLWHYQKSYFSNNSLNRWGFTLSLTSPLYMSFSLGHLELLKYDFLGLDTNGFIFLNDRGIKYCLENDQEISDFPDMYSGFKEI